MTVVSRRAVLTAAVALVVLAMVGAYQGWRRSEAEADVAASTDGLLPVTNAVMARQASALAEPPPPVLTEAQIRTIARQEAQAALRPASEPSQRSSTSSSTPSRPSSPPAATTPTAPPPAPTPSAPSEGGNAPLF